MKSSPRAAANPPHEDISVEGLPSWRKTPPSSFGSDSIFNAARGERPENQIPYSSSLCSAHPASFSSQRHLSSVVAYKAAVSLLRGGTM